MKISLRKQAEARLRLESGYERAWINENDLGDWNAYRWEKSEGFPDGQEHLFHIKDARSLGRDARCIVYSEAMYRFLEETLSYTDVTLD